MVNNYFRKIIFIICCSALANAQASINNDSHRDLLPKPNMVGDIAEDTNQHNIHNAQDKIPGISLAGQPAITQTTANLMTNHKEKNVVMRRTKPRIVDYSRWNHEVDPESSEISRFPECNDMKTVISDDNSVHKNPQLFGTNFLGGTLAQAGAFPPDSMGAVGPSQFIVAINGLIRTFDKTTGLPDNVLDIDTDSFFNVVRDNQGTSDPRIRYDRFSERWFIVMINVANDNNRIMLAMSSDKTITSDTQWSFYYFQPGTGTFFDYPTLGVDVNALYIGGVTFSSNDTGKVFVVNKQSVLNGGPIQVTMFNNVIDPTTGKGPYCPQGVDSFDANSAVGYFIGVDNAYFGRLSLRRIFNPESANPTMSGVISVTVPSTQMPLKVPHKGNTNGISGYLDSIDDRLFCAHMRNGMIWTVHNIGCNNVGVSSPFIQRTRTGSRWYQLDVSKTTPKYLQMATLFQYSDNNTRDRRSFWIPSIMTSGQGHMAIGCSVAGPNDYINCASAGKLASDRLNSIQHASLYTASTTSYNPAEDSGSLREGRRWGDYSYVSVDPCDDMTMWTIQAYCNDTDSWGVRVIKLIAPPPATPNSATPSTLAQGSDSLDITITGLQANGSGFYNPKFNTECALKVTMDDVVVNKVTYVNPTKIVVNVSTTGTSVGQKNVTVTNPDGQSITASGLITVE